jgi:hypothetical protein
LCIISLFGTVRNCFFNFFLHFSTSLHMQPMCFSPTIPRRRAGQLLVPERVSAAV